MKLLSLLLIAVLSSAASAGTPPPRNPYLAASSNAMGHGDSAQQDSVPQAGPDDPGPKLSAGDIDYVHVGPAHFGASTSGPYPDGRRVMWSNGLDRIVKIDHDSFEVLASYEIPGVKHYDEARADASIAKFDASNEGFFAFVNGTRELQARVDELEKEVRDLRRRAGNAEEKVAFIRAKAGHDPCCRWWVITDQVLLADPRPHIQNLFKEKP